MPPNRGMDPWRAGYSALAPLLMEGRGQAPCGREPVEATGLAPVGHWLDDLTPRLLLPNLYAAAASSSDDSAVAVSGDTCAPGAGAFVTFAFSGFALGYQALSPNVPFGSL